MAIHPLSVVDPAAQVDADAIIGPFCVVGPGVTLEAGVELRNHVTVTGRTTIGSGSILFPGAVVGGDPQDRKFRGEDSTVVIGRDCRIHECATVNKGTAGGGMTTTLGDRVLTMAYAHIAHDCRIGDDVVIGNNAQLAGHVVVESKAIISGMVGIHHFVTVGELAFVAAMAGVRVDVPPYLTVDGVPAEPRQVNVVGMRRAGWSDTEVRATKDAFLALYHSRNGTPLAEVIARLNGQDCGQAKPVQRLLRWLGDHLESGVKGRLLESARS